MSPRYLRGSRFARQRPSCSGWAGTAVCLAACFVLLLSCGAPPKEAERREDPAYRTPIAPETLQAFRSGAPIEDKLQAVIAARAALNTTRLQYRGAPEVITVDTLSLAQAHERLEQAGTSVAERGAADARVWLVLLVGEWQVSPPDPEHKITPLPPTYGCAYVIVEARDGALIDAGTLKCTP